MAGAAVDPLAEQVGVPVVAGGNLDALRRRNLCHGASLPYTSDRFPRETIRARLAGLLDGFLP
jgi:hypothetical protein